MVFPMAQPTHKLRGTTTLSSTPTFWGLLYECVRWCVEMRMCIPPLIDFS